MKNILAILISLSSVLNLSSQNFQKFPDGIYLTHDQLKNYTPAYNATLKTITRSSGDLFWSGGNDFKFESSTDSIDGDYIKKKVYAYVKNDSLFINCRKHKLQSWYALAITFGNFIVFNSSVSNNKMVTASILGGAIGGGLIPAASSGSTASILGGAIGGAVVGGNDHLHVLSLRTGNARELNKEYIKNRLAEHPQLLEAYENEKKQDSREILLKYIHQLNLITDPNSEIPSKK